MIVAVVVCRVMVMGVVMGLGMMSVRNVPVKLLPLLFSST